MSMSISNAADECGDQTVLDAHDQRRRHGNDEHEIRSGAGDRNLGQDRRLEQCRQQRDERGERNGQEMDSE